MATVTRRQRRQRKPRRSRPPIIEVPTRLEKDYEKQVQKLIQPINKAVESILKVYAKRLAKRQDDADTDALDAVIRAVLQVADPAVIDAAIEELAISMAGELERFNAERFTAQLNTALGSEGAAGRTVAELSDEIATFAQEQVNLIRSLPAEHLAEVEDLVLAAWERGTSVDDLASQIQERWSVTQSRAKLIANDQLLSFNADMNQIRQEEVGVTTYIWRSREDSRVRPRHRELNGTTQKWDTPTSEGFPGDPINCRCVAEPDFESLLDEEV